MYYRRSSRYGSRPYMMQPYAAPPYYVTQQYAPPPYAPSAYATHHAAPPMPIHKPPQPARPQSAPQPGAHFSNQLLNATRMDIYGLSIVPGDAPVTYPQIFRLEERLLGAIRGAFHVRDHQGTLRYKVDGKISMHEGRELKDMTGQVLLKLREERLRIRDRNIFSSPTNIPVLTLQKATAIQFGDKRVNGYTGPDASGTPAIVITGDSDNTHFRIFNAHKQEVCNVRRRKTKWKNMITDLDSYDVTINYGCPALMCFIAIALDDIYED